MEDHIYWLFLVWLRKQDKIMFIIIVLSHLIAVGLTNNPSIANITMDMWGPYNANE